MDTIRTMAQDLGIQIRVIRRSYQRNMKITLRPNGLVTITTGKAIGSREIEQYLRQSRDWLVAANEKFKALREKHPPKQYLQGEKFLFSGRWISLEWVPSKLKKPFFAIDGNLLLGHVPLRFWHDEYFLRPQPQMKPILLSAYEKKGREVLAKRVEYFANMMNSWPTELSFRSQKTRWGSCSPSGHISLNWRLIATPPEVLDYVVVHELAHLRHPNHSLQFWNLVANYWPEWRSSKLWLRRNSFLLDFLAKRSELHRED